MGAASDAGKFRSGEVAVVRLHHVAFAEGRGAPVVSRLTETLGLDVASVESAPGFVERMFHLDGCALQALEATGDGVVQRFVDKHGPALHHIAFAVEDIDALVAELIARNVRMVDTRPRIGGGGHRIAFAHPDSFAGVLIEFVEESRNA